MKNFKELIIWKNGIELVKSVYLLSKSLPSEKRFGMISQLTPAAVSIPANIAEGSSRNSGKDYARFLHIAFGSAFEVQTYLVIAKEMNWSTNENLIPIESLLEEEIKMMHSFIRKLLVVG